MTIIEAAPYIDQLMVLRKFPRGDQAKKALVALFRRHASDAEHAEAMVASLLEHYSDWPGPAAIREAANATMPDREADRSSAMSQMERWRYEFETKVKPWLCVDCDGYGLLQTSDKTVMACGCHEGQRLSDADIAKWNRGLAQGHGMPLPLRRAHKPATREMPEVIEGAA